MDQKKMCVAESLARRFISSLKLPSGLLMRDGHTCFCDECKTYLGRSDFSDYNYPEGWYLFRVNVSVPQGRSLDEISNNWEMCFHGTNVPCLESVLRLGLRTPGDTDLHGNEINVLPWHVQQYNAPDGFDTERIFLSPSIRYASNDIYALPYCYKSKKSGWTYRVKVVLMVHIRPGSYVVSGTTSGFNIDPSYPDDSIEWASNESDSIVVKGILVSLYWPHRRFTLFDVLNQTTIPTKAGGVYLKTVTPIKSQNNANYSFQVSSLKEFIK